MHARLSLCRSTRCPRAAPAVLQSCTCRCASVPGAHGMISVVTDRNHLTAFIIAALGAHMMRPGRLIALRTGCKTDSFQGIVRTPAAAPRSGCFLDWYCHNDFLLYVAVVYPTASQAFFLSFPSAAKGDCDRRPVSQPHAPLFKFTPHCAHKPLHSSLQCG